MKVLAASTTWSYLVCNCLYLKTIIQCLSHIKIEKSKNHSWISDKSKSKVKRDVAFKKLFNIIFIFLLSRL